MNIAITCLPQHIPSSTTKKVAIEKIYSKRYHSSRNILATNHFKFSTVVLDRSLPKNFYINEWYPEKLSNTLFILFVPNHAYKTS